MVCPWEGRSFNPPSRPALLLPPGLTLADGLESRVVSGVVRSGESPLGVLLTAGQWAPDRKGADEVSNACFLPGTLIRKADASAKMHLLKAQGWRQSQWPVISLCHGSMNPEFRVLLTCSQSETVEHLPYLLGVGTHPTPPIPMPSNGVLPLLENLREMYSHICEDIVISISACLSGKRFHL